MPITVTTEPSILPVTVEMVKKHTNVDITEDDELIEQYIKVATSYGQNITGRMFVAASFELDIDSFPTGKIKLLPSLQSVESVKYTDGEGDEVILSLDEYKVKKTHLVGYIEPVLNWPSDAQDILVCFTSGWPTIDGEGDEEPVSTTPDDIRGWIMVRVAGMYEQRENFITSNGSSVTAMPADFIDNILSCWVVPGIGAGV